MSSSLIRPTALCLALMLHIHAAQSQPQQRKHARPAPSETRSSTESDRARVPHNGSSDLTVNRTDAIVVALGGIVIVLVSISMTVGARRKAAKLEESFDRRIQEWIGGERTRIAAEQSGIATREATVQLETWKRQEEQTIRQDAITRSHSVIVGKVTEHLVPFLPDFCWNPKDARFIGAPVDLIVFDGLDEGQLRSITFVEVKTGASVLTTREKQIREAIEGHRVAWREIRIDSPIAPALSPASAPQLPATSTLARGFFK